MLLNVSPKTQTCPPSETASSTLFYTNLRVYSFIFEQPVCKIAQLNFLNIVFVIFIFTSKFIVINFTTAIHSKLLSLKSKSNCLL